MLLISLLFAFVILVSADNLSSALTASGLWTALSFFVFHGSLI